MDFEGHELKKSTLGDYESSAAASKEVIKTAVGDKDVKIVRNPDSTFTVYIDTCSFIIEREGDVLRASNITPTENQGAWRANILKPLAIKAVSQNFDNL